MNEITYPVAFLAGLLSFLAPCVFPLLPVYLATITGASLSELEKGNQKVVKRDTLFLSLIFILGFSMVFVILGLGASSIGQFFVENRKLLLQISGILLIFFGVLTLGLLDKFSVLQKEFHVIFPKSLLNIKYFGLFLMGISFALAWSPCVGPILGGILTIAATSETLSSGTLLLVFYSLGIALPFLVIALTIGTSLSFVRSIQPYLKYIHALGGVLLILGGLLLLTNQIGVLSGYFFDLITGTSFYDWYINRV